MAYAVVSDIKSMFRKLEVIAETGDDDTNTVVTTEEVEEFIAEEEALLDATLSTYYSTPITGAVSLLIMKKIIKMKVGHVIKGILEVIDAEADLQNEVQGNLDLKANKIIRDLLPQVNKKTGNTERPVTPLPDAVELLTSPKSSNIFKINTDVAQPSIKKGGLNW